jgi:hypothetical protein
VALTVFRAGENINVGDVVAVTTNSVARKAVVGDATRFKAIGVAITSGASQAPFQVIVDGEVHTFSGLVPGDYLYLSNTPGSYYTSYYPIISGLSDTLYSLANVAPFARAISSSGVVLQPSASLLADVTVPYVVTEDSPIEGIYTILTEDGSIIEQEN